MEDGAMPDDNTQTPEPQDAPEEEQPQQQEAPDTSDQLGEPGKAALSAERKARKEAERQLKELTTRLQAIEDKDKSELERAQFRLAELEKQYGEEKAQRLRLSVASQHSIPAEYVDLLTATDEEGLEAQAARVAQLVKASSAPEFARNPGQGAGNGEPVKPSVDSGRDLYRQKHTKI
jgi:flagellar motility protein MotE (MotC chaperone)